MIFPVINLNCIRVRDFISPFTQTRSRHRFHPHLLDYISP